MLRALQARGEWDRTGKFCPSRYPSNLLQKLQQVMQREIERAEASGQTCFSSGVDGVAHGFLARNALLGGHGALKSGDALSH